MLRTPYMALFVYRPMGYMYLIFRFNLGHARQEKNAGFQGRGPISFLAPLQFWSGRERDEGETDLKSDFCPALPGYSAAHATIHEAGR